ncbi:zinc-ribbon domain-containing protein [Furfurilactobacillus milii]|uniref:zinc-ribbon domain-containing protein n=1 Tax=Furfurilactobacillus milii TaxID=2888272 RepID=UPI001F480FDA|nr:zinc ribbon domain-containing protein [Furfurilactobacillus milii]MCF6418919.1 zinc ribbon domain-containing protein [Furfurilactobacillus milii]
MGTKYCTNCGEANALDAEFCINCGMKFPNKSDSPQNKVSTPVKVKSSSPSTSPKRKVTPQADLTSLRKQSRNFFILIVVLAIIVLAGVQIGKYNKTNEQKQKIAKIIDDYWVKGTFDTSINVKKSRLR